MESSFLEGLPSRGNFTKPSLLPPEPLRAYVCAHDTRPPAAQVIRTDPTNILIRALTAKKQQQREDAQGPGAGAKKGSKEAKAGDNGKGKRALEASGAEGPVRKRAYLGNEPRGSASISTRPVNVTGAGAGAGPSAVGGSAAQAGGGEALESMTAEQLRGLLKERGLATKGRKEELVARLRRARSA
eukprot:TRINITY_DN423_c0_g2_i1.p1 TRINITY_DN423_c0_g2~~TRINITY_DN423_c0_g2_i1.p1  ORF type:complete len:186 (+),score=54.32 TRINITY_DN423_c0_g2_i1:297-854(+)